MPILSEKVVSELQRPQPRSQIMQDHERMMHELEEIKTQNSQITRGNLHRPPSQSYLQQARSKPAETVSSMATAVAQVQNNFVFDDEISQASAPQHTEHTVEHPTGEVVVDFG